MKPQITACILALAAALLACNAVVPQSPSSPGAVAPTLPSVADTALPPSAEPPTQVPASPAPPATDTPLPAPTDTPTITPTPTPAVPVLTTLDKPVNCRFGPGVEYETIGALRLGEVAEIQGGNSSGSWWYIRLPQDSSIFCWVATTVTVASGNFATLPIMPPPATFVTRVELKVDPKEVTVPGCSFPYTPISLLGLITVNGPALVEWHWETSQGDKSSTQTLKFDKFGTKQIEDYVKYGAKGDYWVKLVITSPNSKIVQSNYKVLCGP